MLMTIIIEDRPIRIPKLQADERLRKTVQEFYSDQVTGL